MQKKVSVFAFLIVLSLCLFCVGCASEPKVDTSNDQAFVKSMAETYKALPEAERADFGKYFMAAIAGEVTTFGPKSIKEDEYGQLYSMIKLRGGQDAEKYLAAINDMTAKQIQDKGKGIWKSHFELQLVELNTKIAELDEYIKNNENAESERQKVTVESSPVTITEGVDAIGRPWGAIKTFSTDVTITNNSNEDVTGIRGDLIFADESGNEAGRCNLWELKMKELKPSYDYGSPSIVIAPGASWAGSLQYNFSYPKRDKFPYPTNTQYVASTTDVKIVLKGDGERQRRTTEQAALNIKKLKESVVSIQKERENLS